MYLTSRGQAALRIIFWSFICINGLVVLCVCLAAYVYFYHPGILINKFLPFNCVAIGYQKCLEDNRLAGIYFSIETTLAHEMLIEYYPKRTLESIISSDTWVLAEPSGCGYSEDITIEGYLMQDLIDELGVEPIQGLNWRKIKYEGDVDLITVCLIDKMLIESQSTNQILMYIDRLSENPYAAEFASNLLGNLLKYYDVNRVEVLDDFRRKLNYKSGSVKNRLALNALSGGRWGLLSPTEEAYFIPLLIDLMRIDDPEICQDVIFLMGRYKLFYIDEDIRTAWFMARKIEERHRDPSCIKLLEMFEIPSFMDGANQLQ